ncbi:translation initiation factor eIF-2B subunit alpha [Exophiala xenobiotica]|uniref:Translation initiation factor eIF2B subunit alpha n=1 Tax=Vermiconidia calcicola TaxID=1690605 RepID=A0AAV9QE87_9PEZI|nr:translation initiation factor eIF-2B subunit alpha [Exophiala xenobiotica]KAK5539994.1 translation initiation factor eIF-2B subunit alpha [Vermiconidia calcicola]KAK5274579.1 translation initiation factor eIF-2B subunit alpha [Exophiala xenobiotica]KAK5293668.1 translation initiation factor eIF-2B subunit alpha [Exophiala xenobiotica]KAK5385885.1 translation initiation factor eIF-2B subunit alpha [Exophiala xenobiotica]
MNIESSGYLTLGFYWSFLKDTRIFRLFRNTSDPCCEAALRLETPPTTPKSSEQSPTTDFDIVSFYNELVREDSTITPPIAAIEALISLLAKTRLTTISETLNLLSTHSQKLLASQPNPIPLSAGTELFQRYLVSSFQQRPSSLADSDFSTLRDHILTNSSLFVKRANEARLKIAHHALPFIKEESTIITYGYSRVVQALLTHAADALTYALASLPATQPAPQFIVGATSVLENGSIVTELGTHQIGLIAKAVSVPLHIAVESYKFVRNFPLGYGPLDLARMGVRQDVLRFSTGAESQENEQQSRKGQVVDVGEMVEITPPELIDALITENGILTPKAVSEELIKLWF